jgi:predicted metal-dependent phosphoesterase TrpH
VACRPTLEPGDGGPFRADSSGRILDALAGVLKVELHSHSSDDPVDAIPHTTFQLIERAAALGYDAIAITLHDRQVALTPFAGFAQERHIVLIPGIERTIEGKHVLLLNFRRGAEDVRTFVDLARLRDREPGLVVAPHPFFPSPCCLHSQLSRHADLFDAVEYNGMFTPSVNFNAAAERWARTHGKPLVGNGDVHRLEQLGTTYSLVDAEASPDAICAAIRAGHVRVEARAHTLPTALRLAADLFTARLRRTLRQRMLRQAWLREA